MTGQVRGQCYPAQEVLPGRGCLEYAVSGAGGGNRTHDGLLGRYSHPMLLVIAGILVLSHLSSMQLVTIRRTTTSALGPGGPRPRAVASGGPGRPEQVAWRTFALQLWGLTIHPSRSGLLHLVFSCKLTEIWASRDAAANRCRDGWVALWHQRPPQNGRLSADSSCG